QAATRLEALPTTLNHRLRRHCKSSRRLPKHRSFRLAPDPGARTKPKRKAEETEHLLAPLPNFDLLEPLPRALVFVVAHSPSTRASPPCPMLRNPGRSAPRIGASKR